MAARAGPAGAAPRAGGRRGPRLTLVGAGAAPWRRPCRALGAAFGGVMAAVAATYVLGRPAAAVPTTGALVLAGVTVAPFPAAVPTFVQQRHTDVLQNAYSW